MNTENIVKKRRAKLEAGQRDPEEYGLVQARILIISYIPTCFDITLLSYWDRKTDIQLSSPFDQSPFMWCRS